MQTLYGSSLPPGLVASTKGELRLRVDSIILDDDGVNHNPFVQLFEKKEWRGHRSAVEAPNGHPTPHTAEEEVSRGGSGVASTTPLRSPNRFVVPIDHCAVGPIFWGEAKPSAHGQPSTPRQRRGPLTLIYPIKAEFEQFEAYIHRMTASAPHGLRVEVFVPSSYSGRPAVTVGHAVLPLDSLLSRRPLQGWFTVFHSHKSPSPAGAGEVTGPASSEAVVREEMQVPVGKLKIALHMEYFSTPRQTSKEEKGAASRRKANSAGPALMKPHGVRAKGNGEGSNREPALANRTASVLSSSLDGGNDGDTNDKSVQLNAKPQRNGIAVRGPVAHEIFLRGQRLLSDMDSATKMHDDQDNTAPPTSYQHNAVGRETATGHHTVLAAAGAPALPLASSSVENVDDADVESSNDYTSEDSDDETFALQLQKDAEDRDKRPNHLKPVQLRHATSESPAGLNSSGVRRRSGYHSLRQGSLKESCHSGNWGSIVELNFSSLSFAQTLLTADVQEIRIGVRLSTDITTTEPAAGPLSSYIHAVPLQQPSICLSFNVCSFSEEQSKLVVEVYKVVTESQLRVPQGNEAAATSEGTHEISGPHQVVREELLGLCLLGCFVQSRDIIFRDPVTNTNHVYGHVAIDIRSSAPLNSEATERTDMEPEAVQKWGAASSIRRVIATVDEPQPLRKKLVSADSPVSLAKRSDAVHASETASTPTSATPSHRAVQATPPGGADKLPLSNGTAVARHEGYLNGESGNRYSSQALITGNGIMRGPRHSTAPATAMRVCIHNAVELPSIVVSKHSTRSLPLLSTSPDEMNSSLPAKVPYEPPNTFIVVEDVFRCVGSSDMEDSLCRLQPIADWFVEEAQNGLYDRTRVQMGTSSPAYDYVALLRIPHPTPISPSERAEAEPRLMLGDLHLTLWHWADDAEETARPPDSHTSPAATTDPAERHFWARSSYMAACRVDLRPLRYLNVLDGYYRLVCAKPNALTECGGAGRSNGAAIEPWSHEQKTVGYVRISISLL